MTEVKLTAAHGKPYINRPGESCVDWRGWRVPYEYIDRPPIRFTTGAEFLRRVPEKWLRNYGWNFARNLIEGAARAGLLGDGTPAPEDFARLFRASGPASTQPLVLALEVIAPLFGEPFPADAFPWTGSPDRSAAQFDWNADIGIVGDFLADNDCWWLAQVCWLLAPAKGAG